MTRYEYALQDLLGLPLRFAEDLPSDPISKDGLQSSAELLHLTPMQLEAYLESNRRARAVEPRGQWSPCPDSAKAVALTPRRQVGLGSGRSAPRSLPLRGRRAGICGNSRDLRGYVQQSW